MISDKIEMIEGDEAYAGSKSFYQLEQKVKNLTSFRNVIPIHQGPAAEKIRFNIMSSPCSRTRISGAGSGL